MIWAAICFPTGVNSGPAVISTPLSLWVGAVHAGAVKSTEQRGFVCGICQFDCRIDRFFGGQSCDLNRDQFDYWFVKFRTGRKFV